MITPLIIVIILTALVVSGSYVIRARKQGGLRRVQTDTGTFPDENNPGLNFLIRTQTLAWVEVAQHVKLGEFLQLGGHTVSGETYTLIFQVQPSRRIDLICVRVAGVSLRCESGQESISTIAQNGSLIIFTPTEARVEFQTLDSATETPQNLIKDQLFALVVSHVASLTTGNTIHIAARASTLQPKFIKAWDIPSPYADNALLSDMSLKADVAHFAERIKDFQRASVTTEASNEIHFGLKAGVCYVLGQWGGERLAFHGDADIALLVVEAFDPNTSLSEFLNKLSQTPTMHSRLVNRRPEAAQSIEPLLICPNPVSGAHDVIRLYESNAVLTMPARNGALVEVLKVRVDRDVARPMGGQVSLTYFPSKFFQNVLVWRLPVKSG